MTTSAIPTPAIVGAVTVGAVAAVGLFVGLSVLATPSGYRQQVAALQGRAGRAEELLQGKTTPTHYPQNAVCAGSPHGAAAAAKTRIQAAASALNVALSNLDATPAPPGDNGVTLSAVSVRFQASGQYDSVLGMLSTLSRSAPTFFIDSADLKSAVSSVTLNFQGRLYCSASARL